MEKPVITGKIDVVQAGGEVVGADVGFTSEWRHCDRGVV